MKLAGFLTGAGLAGIAVYTFATLTQVTDEDRLGIVLRDHCLPFVMSGEAPFSDLGRAPGVYDNVDLRPDLTEGGARLIYDNRFTAQWGLLSGQDGSRLRACIVDPTYGENMVAGFQVDEDGFVDRMTALVAPFDALVPNQTTFSSGPTIVGWFGADRPQSDGLRMVLTVAPGVVSGLIVGTTVDAG